MRKPHSHPSFLALGLIVSVSALLLGCASKAKVSEFSELVDRRIQEDLDKRASLVQKNPVYQGLLTELQKGRAFLLQGNPKEAFLTFDGILQNTRYTNFPEYSYSKYYLSVALHEMNVNYGALLYFVDIVQKESLRAHTHESLRRAIEIAQSLRDDELILFLASSIEPNKVPLSLREEFRYFIAKDLYQKGEFKKSIELLTTIPHRNRLYLAAQYLLGAIATKQKNLRQAVENFRTISNTRSPVDYYEEHRIRQLSNLALGRIFYEEKNYPLSIVYYDKVERDDEFYPFAIYESSWGLFKLHKFNEALSVLHSLQSPFFEHIYFLKSFLLKGAIFIELCHYEQAVETLKYLSDRFEVLKGQIDGFAKQARDPQQYYPVLSSTIKKPNGEQEYKYEDLFKLSAANRDFLSIHRYITRLENEREILRSIKSDRGTLLARLIQQKERDLAIEASWLAGKKMVLTRSLIRDFESVEDLVQYEIISAERKILQSRTRGIAPPVLKQQDLIRPEFTDSLRETLTWWDYNGEYWEDEIGFYLYNLESRCKTTAEVKDK